MGLRERIQHMEQQSWFQDRYNERVEENNRNRQRLEKNARKNEPRQAKAETNGKHDGNWVLHSGILAGEMINMGIKEMYPDSKSPSPYYTESYTKCVALPSEGNMPQQMVLELSEQRKMIQKSRGAIEQYQGENRRYLDFLHDMQETIIEEQKSVYQRLFSLVPHSNIASNEDLRKARERHEVDQSEHTLDTCKEFEIAASSAYKEYLDLTFSQLSVANEELDYVLDTLLAHNSNADIHPFACDHLADAETLEDYRRKLLTVHTAPRESGSKTAEFVMNRIDYQDIIRKTVEKNQEKYGNFSNMDIQQLVSSQTVAHYLSDCVKTFPQCRASLYITQRRCGRCKLESPTT